MIKNKNIFGHQFFWALYLLCPSVVFGANWNDPNVTLVQSVSDHAYRDANTGQYVSTKGMPGTTTAPTTGSPIPPPVVPTSVQPNTNTGTPSAATPTGNTAAAASKTTAKSSGGIKATATKAAKGAGAALGAAAGGYMVYDSAKGSDKHNVGNLIEGTSGGAIAGAAIGSVVPVVGTGLGAAIGAVVGGAVAGSQLFSETDCLTDPVTDDFTCCNTVFNKGKRQAAIGDYMFCGNEKGTQIIGMVRQCQQAKSATKDTWWNGLWKDDAWTPGCIQRYCDGEIAPASGLDEYVLGAPDVQNFCWRWKCIDGYTRSGDTCVSDIDGSTPTNQYDIVINKINLLRQHIMSQCDGMM